MFIAHLCRFFVNDTQVHQNNVIYMSTTDTTVARETAAHNHARCSGPRHKGELRTRSRRRVAPRATACAPPASVPAARSRLCAITAQASQAQFAANSPDGIWASGPSIRSAKVVSTMACLRWVMSASVVGRSELVKNG